jgi:hypothetical protein
MGPQLVGSLANQGLLVLNAGLRFPFSGLSWGSYKI